MTFLGGTFAKPESFVGLRGRIALLIFDNSGEVIQVVPFGPQEDVAGADIPCDTWHTVISLEAGSVFYEAKPGPLIPATKATWRAGHRKGSPKAAAYLQGLVDLVPGAFGLKSLHADKIG